jgi:hypothetical protein
MPDVEVVDTTSAAGWSRGLSPFVLGPCDLYPGAGREVSENFENLWQYAKVYKQHVDDAGEPTEEYWKWARKGWAALDAHRYPMGKGAVPEYSLWDGRHLGYVDARKVIYGPLYAQVVQTTPAWRRLVQMYHDSREIYLRDWDGWDMVKHKMENLTQVLNNPRRKMGHAFVLKMLLEEDPALEQMDLR